MHLLNLWTIDNDELEALYMCLIRTIIDTIIFKLTHICMLNLHSQKSQKIVVPVRLSDIGYCIFITLFILLLDFLIEHLR